MAESRGKRKSSPTAKGRRKAVAQAARPPVASGDGTGSATGMERLLEVMAALRGPNGCPWDREQTHLSLRPYAVEEVYELLDAIESGDDAELVDELGDLLLQVIFHCQMASERDAFNFTRVCQQLTEKLIRRHPHVFGDVKAENIADVWREWDKVKKSEQAGKARARTSALDGVPRHLPALLRVEKLVKKAVKAGLWNDGTSDHIGDVAEPVAPPKGSRRRRNLVKPTETVERSSPSPAATVTPLPDDPAAWGKQLFALVAEATRRGWSCEDLLRTEIARVDGALRALEQTRAG